MQEPSQPLVLNSTQFMDMLENQPWAMRDFTQYDPSGVLWRITQNLPRPGESLQPARVGCFSFASP
jgi:hypothetical protein